MTDTEKAEAFARADKAIQGQWRNVEAASQTGSPLNLGAERLAAQVLNAQLVAVLGPLGYEPKDRES